MGLTFLDEGGLCADVAYSQYRSASRWLSAEQGRRGSTKKALTRAPEQLRKLGVGNWELGASVGDVSPRTASETSGAHLVSVYTGATPPTVSSSAAVARHDGTRRRRGRSPKAPRRAAAAGMGPGGAGRRPAARAGEDPRDTTNTGRVSCSYLSDPPGPARASAPPGPSRPPLESESPEGDVVVSGSAAGASPSSPALGGLGEFRRVEQRRTDLGRLARSR